MGKNLNGKEIGTGFTQRKDGKYEFNKSIKGNRITLYDTNLRVLKDKAKKAVYDAEHSVNNEEKGINAYKNITLNDWHKLYVEYKKDKVKKSTLDHYTENYKRYFYDGIGKEQISKIKTIQIDNIYRKLKDEIGVSPNSINLLNAILSNIFEYACRKDIIVKNPCKHADLPKKTKAKKRVLTKREQVIFMEKIKGHYYESLYLLALSTGMRIGEICGLKWSDINLDDYYLNVNRTLVYLKNEQTKKYTFSYQPPKTTNSERLIVLNDEITDVLKDHKAKQEKQLESVKDDRGELLTDQVFLTKRKTIVCEKYLLADLDDIVDSINRDEFVNAKKENRDVIIFERVTPHAFRHTFATRSSESSIDKDTLGVFLGHSSYEITDEYTHYTKERLLGEREKLNSVLNVS